MYYTGTLTEIREYIKKVDDGEKFGSTTKTWAEPIKHPTQDLYCVIAHPKYNSNLESSVNYPFPVNNDIL